MRIPGQSPHMTKNKSYCGDLVDNSVLQLWGKDAEEGNSLKILKIS
jgi:hypothetical protein